MISNTSDFQSVNSAFSKQSSHFDEEDLTNPILQDLRKQVYAHVGKVIKPGSRILELNSGTGIDAFYFISKGHTVHATDLSDGMIEQIKSKSKSIRPEQLTFQQVSFDNLDLVDLRNFDFVFSNFGGLNCIQDLSAVTKYLPALLKPGAHVTWVIMPPVCLWEVASLLKGNKNALRRFHKNGVLAHLEGNYFKTYYHSLAKIKSAFPNSFRFVFSEGLAALSPPPHHLAIAKKYPRFYSMLKSFDNTVRMSFPFNRWADHIIVTFQYLGD